MTTHPSPQVRILGNQYLVVLDGHPLDPTARVLAVVVEGRIVHRATDLAGTGSPEGEAGEITAALGLPTTAGARP